MEQKVITSIFDSWNETIIWSCLQDVMGEIHTNSEEDAAMAILGDFAFLAGKPSEELIRLKPESCKQNFIIMVPHNAEWAELIEKCYRDKAKKVTGICLWCKAYYGVLEERLISKLGRA